MDIPLILRVLLRRRALRQQALWDRTQLEQYQAQKLAELRAWAYDKSPFYRIFHSGKEQDRLGSLPALTKGQLMESFDSIATDPRIHLKEVRASLDSGTEYLNGSYVVNATGGTTGSPGIFLFNRREWTEIIASYSRAYEWAGIQADLLHRVRMAVVSSRTPLHQSARVGVSVDSPWTPTLRLDATSPLEEIISQLNDFRPESLIGYAGMLQELANAQRHGSLRINPKAVLSASEVLSVSARQSIMQAWLVAPFDVYGATETSTIATECDCHNGMHLFEDLVITEVVDDHYRPVPDGEFGEKLLVTVLFSRTLPLIRYEITDSVRMSSDLCSCGRVFKLLVGVQGRAEDTLQLPGKDGRPVRIHPNVFHKFLESRIHSRWQARWNGTILRVLIEGSKSILDTETLHDVLAQTLQDQGVAAIQLDVTIIDRIPKTRLGKTKLVVDESTH